MPSLEDLGSARVWRGISLLLFFPVAAVLHHAVFFRPTCMLNPFGLDYTPSVVKAWLAADPSPAWAIALCFVAYHAGNSVPSLRQIAAPVFVAFLPLTLWIWDLPFFGRPVCAAFHDEQVRVAGLVLHTRHLYFLGAILWVGLFARLKLRGAPAAGEDQP